MNRNVCLGDQIPQRIVSLVPSITELLFDLGLHQQIVGCTKFCIHPQSETSKLKKIGGTKNIDIQTTIELKPDLVIGNKEENTINDIELLSASMPVWMSDVNTLSDALNMIHNIGVITGTEQRASAIHEQIKDSFSNSHASQKTSAIYLIWNQPMMAAASDTFINSMLDHAGFINLVGDKSRYPELTLEELRHLNPQVLMLSTEPFPFKKQHVDFFSDQLPETKVIIVDGTYFSWYGSRMIGAVDYFSKLTDSNLKPVISK
jgi:ABC-type Fe3+-hydroxamate transport system substrate-binding protein